MCLLRICIVHLTHPWHHYKFISNNNKLHVVLDGKNHLFNDYAYVRFLQM